MLPEIVKLAGFGDLDGVHSLLIRGEVEPDAARDERGNTALHCACNNGQVEVVGVLLEAGSSPSLVNHDGRTPLHLACFSGYSEVVSKLLQGDALLDDALDRLLDDAFMNCQDTEECTAMHYACANGNVSVVEILLGCATVCGCNPPTHRGTCRLDLEDAWGSTPREVALEFGQYDVVRLLDRHVAENLAARRDSAPVTVVSDFEPGRFFKEVLAAASESSPSPKPFSSAESDRFLEDCPDGFFTLARESATLETTPRPPSESASEILDFPRDGVAPWSFAPPSPLPDLGTAVSLAFSSTTEMGSIEAPTEATEASGSDRPPGRPRFARKIPRSNRKKPRAKKVELERLKKRNVQLGKKLQMAEMDNQRLRNELEAGLEAQNQAQLKSDHAFYSTLRSDIQEARVQSLLKETNLLHRLLDETAEKQNLLHQLYYSEHPPGDAQKQMTEEGPKDSSSVLTSPRPMSGRASSTTSCRASTTTSCRVSTTSEIVVASSSSTAEDKVPEAQSVVSEFSRSSSTATEFTTTTLQRLSTELAGELSTSTDKPLINLQQRILKRRAIDLTGDSTVVEDALETGILKGQLKEKARRYLELKAEEKALHMQAEQCQIPLAKAHFPLPDIEELDLMDASAGGNDLC